MTAFSCSEQAAEPAPHRAARAAPDRGDDDLEVFRAFGLPRSWPPGATLLRQGERPELLFVIERGEVELWDESLPDRRFVQRVLAGASIGDLPVLLEEPCLYSAVAHGETDTLGFSRTMVCDLLERDPQICFLLLRALSRRIQRGYARHVALAGRSATERVGLFLLSELDDGDTGSIDVTQSQLASATGLSRQRIAEVLAAFERLGVLERGRATVRVLDERRLRALLPHPFTSDVRQTP